MKLQKKKFHFIKKEQAEKSHCSVSPKNYKSTRAALARRQTHAHRETFGVGKMAL